MSTWFIFTLAVLATHRLTVLIADDRITEPLRDMPDRGTMLYYGLRCFRCSSVWMASLVTAFLYNQNIIEWPWPPVAILALSSAAICIERLTTCKK